MVSSMAYGLKQGFSFFFHTVLHHTVRGILRDAKSVGNRVPSDRGTMHSWRAHHFAGAEAERTGRENE